MLTIISNQLNKATSAWNETLPLRHEISQRIKKVYDTVAPHQSVRRYLLGEILPGVFKVGTVITVAGIQVLSTQQAAVVLSKFIEPYGFIPTVHSLAEYNSSVLLTTAGPVLIGLQLDDKKMGVAKAVLGTYVVAGSLLAAKTIGHNIFKSLGDKPHSDKLDDVSLETLMGYLIGGLVITVGGFCVYECSQSVKNHFDDWKVKQAPLLEKAMLKAV